MHEVFSMSYFNTNVYGYTLVDCCYSSSNRNSCKEKCPNVCAWIAMLIVRGWMTILMCDVSVQSQHLVKTAVWEYYIYTWFFWCCYWTNHFWKKKGGRVHNLYIVMIVQGKPNYWISTMYMYNTFILQLVITNKLYIK